MLGMSASVLTDIRSFEISPLYGLVGFRGVLILGSFLAFFGWLLYFSTNRALGRVSLDARAPTWIRLFVSLNLLLIVWIAEWVFFEYPPTASLVDSTVKEEHREAIIERAIEKFSRDGSLAALHMVTSDHQMDEQAVAIMLARITVNRPSVFGKISIGKKS